MFHMPLFFIISGILYVYPKNGIIGGVKKRFRSLVIPYFFFLFISLLYRFLAHEEIPMSIFTWGDKVYALWFLQVMFFAQIFYIIINKYIKRNTIKVCLVTSISLFGYAFYQKSIHFPYRLEVTCLALFFYGFGDILKEQLIRLKIDNLRVLFLLLTTFVYSFFVPRLDMADNNYGSYIPNLVGACLGSVAVISLSKSNIFGYIYCLYIKQFLLWAGKNSLVILGLSPILNMSIKFILLNFHLPFHIRFLAQHTILWIMLYGLSYILTKYTPFFVGKKINDSW